ncbi:Alpha-methyldopa hypersensitive protein [Lasiodiplodia theobromae]|uniref:Alpha-methyldopa hypersensitive protein n=1 Tax=Lasiodiplodia theobromae TaxID=45133 RepID=A0A5N5DSR5_9PEZI|nr:Alpha-methyldopa hypersensitive protein [Lasiodiplodia theobromae]
MPIQDIDALHGTPLPFGYLASAQGPVLPSAQVLDKARSALVHTLPETGLGYQRATSHLVDDIVPALNANSRSANYYGFVTGGATPAAALADNLVTAYDQNVQVHLPNETVATDVEDQALRLLCQLLKLDPDDWPHRTFTTGATASNVLGLACAREHVLRAASSKTSGQPVSVGELGIVEAMRAAGVDSVQILTTVPHSSLAKAASIVGLGRASVKSVCLPDASHRFDIAKLEAALALERTASIVAISCSEVNTGRFATSGYAEMAQIRNLCDKYGAWIHVDAAFGLLARALATDEFSQIISATEGMELVDSITGDGHKLLNVPYDCGFFFSRHLQTGQDTFQNANAAYLNAGAAGSGSCIPSPLNIGIENSRRFRALPVYASLVAYGREGYREMLERQIRLSRAIAGLILDHAAYELLPQSDASRNDILGGIYIIVLFRARNETLNRELVKRINATSKIYVSGTSWEGAPACRFAVSNWQVDQERDLAIIREVLDTVSREL